MIVMDNHFCFTSVPPHDFSWPRHEVASSLTMGTVGTFYYTAPEMLRSPYYDEKAKINRVESLEGRRVKEVGWQLGCCFSCFLGIWVSR